MNITIISPEVAAGDRDVSVWLEVAGGALTMHFTKLGRELTIALIELESGRPYPGLDLALAAVLKQLPS